MRPGRLALPLALVLAVAGCDRCNTEVIQQLPQPTVQPDVFTQKGAARVDVLWMIDNSGSMAAEQEKVADRFGEFFQQLIVSQVDYHIGVITSDPADRGVLRPYTGPSVDNCASGSCRFITKDVPCANPTVDIASLATEQAKEAALAAECPAQLVFRKLIKVGVNGSSFEEGFTQAATALGARNINPSTGFPDGQVPAENADFLRDDASLYVVFVSDEEEGAKQDGTPVRYYQRLFEGLKSAGNENNVTVAAITGFPNGFAGLAPAPVDIERVCPILQTTFDNNPANDDPQAALVQETLRDFRGNRCIDVEAAADDGNAVAEVGGRYIELACRTGGVVANMCDGDYSTALDALGANAAGLLRKFTVSEPTRIFNGSDCQLFGLETDPNIDCDGDGKKDGANDAPMCVVAQCVGESEPSLKVRGRDWDWEESTSSVRFSGGCVPAPNTDVVISYGLRPDSDQTCGG
jgi:hypothetical protein